MKTLSDFQIIQRGEDGFGVLFLEGTLPEGWPDGAPLHVAVLREDDMLYAMESVPCTVEGRAWKVEARIPEGGLYRIQVRNAERCVLDACHVGVGDIFVAAGQSNMAGYGTDAAYDPVTLGVHMFSQRGRWQLAMHSLWEGPGSCPALSFGRRLKEQLGVPIGIVASAVGGSFLWQWIPRDGGGQLYEAMCRQLEEVGPFKGYIWSQGCSDTNDGRAPQYLDNFREMLSDWEKKLGPHPMLTIQLNRWMAENSQKSDAAWGILRDAQRRAALELENVYCVPSIDMSVTDGIHNSGEANVVLGERLANVALKELYHRPGQTAAAVTGAEYVDETHFQLRFTPGHSVSAMDGIPCGMDVEDAGGLIPCVKAVCAEDGDGLIVETERPYALPARMHYAWRTHPPAFFLRDAWNMPVLACYGVEIAAPHK
jgi:hypothetical protein